MNLKSSRTSGFVLREAGADDERGIHEVISLAFDHHQGVADLWAEVVRCGHDRVSLVAVDGDEVVGHVGVSHAWLDARRALVDVWMLSPLSSRPDRQRGGIGTALVAAAIAASREVGVPALFLEGDPRFYGPRGFEAASDRGFLPPSARIPDRAFQVVSFEAHEEWMAGALVYHDVWWEHDAAGLRDPRLAEVERALGRSRTHVR
ncbi:MAG: GNAT family N-acetyltransferase [Nocardioides sp.]